MPRTTSCTARKAVCTSYVRSPAGWSSPVDRLKAVMSSSVVFNICTPRLWAGRYARIPGDRSVFHVQANGGRWCSVIFWQREDGLGTCVAVDSPTVRQLTAAVTAAKRQLGGTGGGSFQINEFGQVLVPASDNSGRRLIIGELSG